MISFHHLLEELFCCRNVALSIEHKFDGITFFVHSAIEILALLLNLEGLGIVPRKVKSVDDIAIKVLTVEHFHMNSMRTHAFITRPSPAGLFRRQMRNPRARGVPDARVGDEQSIAEVCVVEPPVLQRGVKAAD